MAEGEAPKPKGIGGFLKSSTGPLPNWAWLVVIVGGAAMAYFIPKFFGGGKTKQPDQTSTDQGTSNSGLGLAMDPVTGLPYAVEGLVPSGGVVGTQSGQLPPPPPPPTPTPTPTPTPKPPPRRRRPPDDKNDIVRRTPDDKNDIGRRPIPMQPLPTPTTTSPAWPGGTTQKRIA